MKACRSRIINEGLADLVASLDGTRYYTGSSNSINLQGSGPYNYRPPEQYFTELAQGFSVEVGTPSLSTLESLRASIPEADRWPLSDTYAYHDWHFGGNGDVATFMAALAEQFGAGASLEDFERKAQMMNYVSYRAIFEGFQAHLWTKNSGRLLWMTHPSWPSNSWQIYSSDYDTAAAYYAVKKACEPLHAQLNLPDFTLAVANISRAARPHLQLRSRLMSLDNRLLGERVDSLGVAANSVATLASSTRTGARARRVGAGQVDIERCRRCNLVRQPLLAGAGCGEPAAPRRIAAATDRHDRACAHRRRGHAGRSGAEEPRARAGARRENHHARRARSPCLAGLLR